MTSQVVDLDLSGIKPRDLVHVGSAAGGTLRNRYWYPYKLVLVPVPDQISTNPRKRIGKKNSIGASYALIVLSKDSNWSGLVSDPMRCDDDEYEASQQRSRRVGNALAWRGLRFRRVGLLVRHGMPRDRCVMTMMCGTGCCCCCCWLSHAQVEYKLYD